MTLVYLLKSRMEKNGLGTDHVQQQILQAELATCPQPESWNALETIVASTNQPSHCRPCICDMFEGGTFCRQSSAGNASTTAYEKRNLLEQVSPKAPTK